MQNDAILAITGQIVSSYVSNNSIPRNEVPAFLTETHRALTDAATGSTTAPQPADPTVRRATQAEIKKSVTDDAITSFIDGKGYKTLRRHLAKHGMTPEQYRAKFGLSFDYPMTAPGYSKRRSALAKSIGLGQVASKRTA